MYILYSILKEREITGLCHISTWYLGQYLGHFRGHQGPPSLASRQRGADLLQRTSQLSHPVCCEKYSLLKTRTWQFCNVQPAVFYWPSLWKSSRSLTLEPLRGLLVGLVLRPPGVLHRVTDLVDVLRVLLTSSSSSSLGSLSAEVRREAN